MPDISASAIVAFLAMLVSLAAVIVGPVANSRIARRQIISPMRQKWINELRDLMSTLLSKCRLAVIMTEAGGLLEESKPNVELLSEILFLEQKLELMLNPNESDHKILVTAVGAITDSVQHGAKNVVEFGQKLSDASTCCKSILKREWERVKRGED